MTISTIRMQIILCLILLHLAACERKNFPITAPAGEAISDFDAELDDTALSFMYEEGVTGLGLVIYKDEKLYRTGYGFENYRDDTPVDPDQTLFRWASLSKAVTGTIAVLMEEKGIISLDDKANELVPNYRDPQKYYNTNGNVRNLTQPYEATLKDLLTHRSGIRHFSNGAGTRVVPFNFQANNPRVNTGMEWAFHLWTGQPLAVEPGTYSYSNMGYHLAGAMLERASGKSYEELLIEYIADPLELDTLRSDKYWVDYPHRATGYKKRRSEERFASRKIRRNDASWMASGGGLMSSTKDLGLFCKAFLNEDLVSYSQKYGKLWNPEYGYGLGFGIGNWYGLDVYLHYGNWDGASGVYAIIPRLNICFGALANSRGIDMTKISNLLLERFTTFSEGAPDTQKSLELWNHEQGDFSEEEVEETEETTF